MKLSSIKSKLFFNLLTILIIEIEKNNIEIMIIFFLMRDFLHVTLCFLEPSSLLSLVWSLSMTRMYPRPEIVFISTFDSDKTALRLKIALCSEKGANILC